jgi:hypothetical protein
MTQKQMLIGLAVVAAAGVAYWYWQKRKQQQAESSPASTPTGGAPTVSNPGVLEQATGVVNTAGDALRQLGDIFG